MVKIKYTLNNQTNQSQTFENNDQNLNFILSTNTENNNSWINFGINKNTTKFQGQVLENNKNLTLYKTIDEIKIDQTQNNTNQTVEEVEYTGIKIKKQIKINETTHIHSYKYSEFNTLIFTTNNIEKELILELDCRELNDYTDNERIYEIYEKEIKTNEKTNNYTIIKYNKNNKYQLYLAIENKNIEITQLNNWIKKSYDYSKIRNTSDEDLYIFQALKFKPTNKENNKEIFISSGFSENEVINNIKKTKTNFSKTQIKIEKISENKKVNLAYNLAQNALTQFKIQKGNKAGFLWFNQVWTRDELSSLNYEIENKNYKQVKETINKYIQLIGECGLIPIIQEKGALNSPDGLFWLGKRLNDFIKQLEKSEEVENYLSTKELEEILEKLEKAFDCLFTKYRDEKTDLLITKHGDSWMDTIEINFPADIQIQLLSFVEILVKLSELLKDTQKQYNYTLLIDFIKENIKDKYYKNGFLFDNIENTRITCNTFLAYYFYRNLFNKKQWEGIFDKTLPKLETTWGGISSLDNKNENFVDTYSGQNNKSYHNGDSWYWINNLAGIVLTDLNYNKYEQTINRIVESSTKDILELGTIGFSSEISQAKSQVAQGCMAQLWSSAYYVELIKKINK